MTITFMKELMQWYKDQKKLHRKCAYQVTHLSGAARTWEPWRASRLWLHPDAASKAGQGEGRPPCRARRRGGFISDAALSLLAFPSSYFY